MITYDFARYLLQFLTMVHVVVDLLGRGVFHKVGVSRTREATFGAERIVWAVLGNHSTAKYAEIDGRVVKNEGPGIC